MVQIFLLFILSFNPIDKSKLLFNGKDLDGWKIYGTEKWYVQDGELVCESGPNKEYGYLATNQNYKNFILELDFFQESMVIVVFFLDLQLKVQKFLGGKLK
ncbi:MAG: hypothetical protein Ct9H90mP3_3290 [Flammeovirgaceae bacterium]|nr:MAG: hypothetical protein Ct9H90mP3_3290 [Flammeovirgaceae bacterium]